MHKHKIFKEAELVSAKLWGEITFKELLEANYEMIHDPDYQPHFKGISDEREAVMKLSREEMITLSEMNDGLEIAMGIWAHLLSPGASSACADNYVENAKRVHPANVFTRLEDAAKFLNIEDLRPYSLEMGVDI